MRLVLPHPGGATASFPLVARVNHPPHQSRSLRGLLCAITRRKQSPGPKDLAVRSQQVEMARGLSKGFARFPQTAGPGGGINGMPGLRDQDPPAGGAGGVGPVAGAAVGGAGGAFTGSIAATGGG